MTLVTPRQTAFIVPKLEKPVIVVDSDEEGEKKYQFSFVGKFWFLFCYSVAEL